LIQLEKIREITSERELPQKFREIIIKQEIVTPEPTNKLVFENVSILNRLRNDKQDRQMEELLQYQVCCK
jgi:hypothetical protein